MKVETALWKKEPLTEIIKRLAIESDIPEDVLYSWLDGSYKNARKIRTRVNGRHKCRLCSKNAAEIATENKRTYGKMLCSVCRKKATEAKKRNMEVAFDDGFITVCPRCSFAFLTKEEGDGS